MPGERGMRKGERGCGGKTAHTHGLPIGPARLGAWPTRPGLQDTGRAPERTTLSGVLFNTILLLP